MRFALIKYSLVSLISQDYNCVNKYQLLSSINTNILPELLPTWWAKTKTSTFGLSQKAEKQPERHGESLGR